MSGGAFNYREMQLLLLAEEIETEVEDSKDPELLEYAKTLAERLRVLRKDIKLLDYYLSGDTGYYKEENRG